MILSSNKLRVRQQRGVSLTIVLILLLIMTLLGLASMRVGLLEEKMGASQFDRSLSFQAVEAAIREAEARIEVNPTPTFPASGNCVAGLCPTPTAGATNLWEVAAPPAGTWFNATTNITQSGLTVTPTYMIQYMGKTPKNLSQVGLTSDEEPETVDVFRITARSTQADRATVIIQSNYTKP
jgi:type IV pilus assembly protein PilX